MSTISKNIGFGLTASIFMVFLMLSQAGAAKGNLSVSKDVVLNASPETVWKLVGSFNGLDVWHPVVVASKQNGSMRTLTLGDGATIMEKLIAHSDTNHSYSYAITESPLPVKDYVSSISVTSAKDGKSIVRWSSTFDANNAPDEKATEVITGVYNAGLDNLAKYFND